MKTILADGNSLVLRIDKGEEVVEKLREFAEAEGVDAASFSLIGAAGKAELWWYDPALKEYQKKTFSEQLEITHMLGNIAKMQGETVVHAHGTFARKDYSTLAGHVRRAVISGACEVSLQKLSGSMERSYDEDTGLNLLR